jgi:cytochrome c-type biogenesis protein
MGAFALAFLAGVLSFSSPCCLPLMPGYVSYVSGVAGGAATIEVSRRRAVAAAALFVLGFSIVFILLGAAVTSVSSTLLSHREAIARVSGLLVIAMGLLTLGVLRIPILSREARFQLHRMSPGPGGALPLGMAFAIGWTPCIGPVLAAILTAAASTSAPARGAALLATYSFGLGLPFLLLAFGAASTNRIAAALRRHGRGVETAGGLLLVLIGVLMITGAWQAMFTPIARELSRLGWPPL